MYLYSISGGEGFLLFRGTVGRSRCRRTLSKDGPAGFGGPTKLDNLRWESWLITPKTNGKFAPEKLWLEDFLVSFWGVLRAYFQGIKLSGSRF